MKRKIAILLATVMTATALPTSIFAVNTAAPGLENSVIQGIAGQTLGGTYPTATLTGLKGTTNAETSTLVNNYKLALSQRDGVLKVALAEGNQNVTLEAGTTFDIKLENATFKDEVLGVDKEKVRYQNVRASYTGTPGTDVDGIAAPVLYTVQNGELIKEAYTDKEATTAGEPTKVEFTNNPITVGDMLGEIKDPYVGKKYASAKNDTVTPAITQEEADKNIAYVKEMANNSVSPLPHIPYSINVKDDKTATVTILTKVDLKEMRTALAVPGYYNAKTDGGIFLENQATTNAYFAIPLGSAITVDGGEEVKAHVMGYGNEVIKDGIVTLAKVSNNGSTSINSSYIEKKVFEDRLLNPTDVIVQENTRGTFENGIGKVITLRLSRGFEFINTDAAITMATDSANNLVKDVKFATNDNSRLEITLKDDAFPVTTRTQSIRIKLPGIQAVNETKDYGTVSLSIYGAGISEQSVDIAERQNLGFKLETKTEIPTIVKGRFHSMNPVLKSNSNMSAEVEFAESVPNSLLSQRSVDFKVPAGVKIADFDLLSATGFSLLDKDGKTTTINQQSEDYSFDIIDDGTTLRLNRNTFKSNGNNVAAKLRFKLDLSVDAGYTDEDITLSVTGGGISKDITTVIAKTEAPFTITATPKNINIGYQDYDANDITITETKAGMFMEGEDVIVAIDAPYGTQELGFTGAKVETTGNLEIKTANSYLTGSGSGREIKVSIKARSTNEPASIKISNVKIGTTRSVPFGAYNLLVGGKAIINNDVIVNSTVASDLGTLANDIKLDNTVNSVTTEALTSEKLAQRIDATTGSYRTDGYINVVTANDTIDREMKVTIGSTTAVIQGSEVAMDVAPYIQADGNTMVPLRFVAVALSGGDASSVEAAQNSENIQWDPNSKTVTIFNGAGTNQKIIQFVIGSSIMTVDGTKVPMTNNAKAEIKDGRTFVPFRSLGQALGVPVSWDATTKTASFNAR